MKNSIRNTFSFLALAAASVGAMAHTGVDSHAHVGFVSGFMHPLGGIDHLAVMVAVGVWSALVAPRWGREMLWGPLGFANVLIAGAALGLQGVGMGAVEPLIAASVVAMGLLVVSRLALPGVWMAGLAGLFALFHGVAHGRELAEQVNAFPALAGMLCATLLLHSMGLGLGWALRGSRLWVARALGATVSALGGVLLLLQLG